MQVNSNLKKMSDDSEGIIRPEPVPFYRNKVYIAMAAIIFFIFGGYMVAKGAIGSWVVRKITSQHSLFIILTKYMQASTRSVVYIVMVQHGTVSMPLFLR